MKELTYWGPNTSLTYWRVLVTTESGAMHSIDSITMTVARVYAREPELEGVASLKVGDAEIHRGESRSIPGARPASPEAWPLSRLRQDGERLGLVTLPSVRVGGSMTLLLRPLVKAKGVDVTIRQTTPVVSIVPLPDGVW